MANSNWGYDTAGDLINDLKLNKEIEFVCRGKEYSIIPVRDEGYSITEANKEDTEQTYLTPEEVLDYDMGSYKLRDAIQDIEITFISY